MIESHQNITTLRNTNICDKLFKPENDNVIKGIILKYYFHKIKKTKDKELVIGYDLFFNIIPKNIILIIFDTLKYIRDVILILHSKVDFEELKKHIIQFQTQNQILEVMFVWKQWDSNTLYIKI